MEADEFVNIKCNSCGKVWSFCPFRVMLSPECDCGNDDCGRPGKWKDYAFGNFTYIGSDFLRSPSFSWMTRVNIL